jgi:hypothetical protein
VRVREDRPDKRGNDVGSLIKSLRVQCDKLIYFHN